MLLRLMGLRRKTAASSSPVAPSIALYNPIIELDQDGSRLITLGLNICLITGWW